MTAEVGTGPASLPARELSKQHSAAFVTSELEKGLHEYASPLGSVRQDALSRMVYVVSERTGACRAFEDQDVKSALQEGLLGQRIVRAVTERLACVSDGGAAEARPPDMAVPSSDETQLAVHLLQVVMLTLEGAAKVLDLRSSTCPSKVLTDLLQPENGCMAAALTTLQIFLHLNAAERLRYVHSGSVAELTRLLKTNQMTPGSEAHTLALELLAMLCHDLCSSGQGDASKSVLRVVSIDLGGDATTILNQKSSTGVALDEAELETRVALLRKALSLP